MKILVLSDSHGHLQNAKKVIKRLGSLDMILHLGDIVGQDNELMEACDCPVEIVKGNCDFYSANDTEKIITLGKNRVFMAHGHHYGVDGSLDRLCAAAEARECNIALYGHTHCPELREQNGITVMNPGSITQPRQYGYVPTYGMIDIDEDGNAHCSLCQL